MDQIKLGDTVDNFYKITAEIPALINGSRVKLVKPEVSHSSEMLNAIVESFNTHAYWLGWGSKVPSLKEVKTNIESARMDFEELKNLKYHVLSIQNNQFIGRVGFYKIDWKVPKCEIGYWCRKNAQGLGYVKEAVNLCTNLAFNVIKAKRIEIRCNPRNIAANQLALKLNYKLEATLRNFQLDDNGQIQDINIFSKIENN